MKKLLGFFLALLPLAAWAQPIKFGLTNLVPGRVFEFSIPLSAQAKGAANQAGNSFVNTARFGLAVPAGFDLKKPWQLLIVSSPSGGSPIAALRGYTNVALAEGWVLFAAEGPAQTQPKYDTFAWRGVMLGSALDTLHRNWPESARWPVACAGFSGGAKMSGSLGAILARQNYELIGIFMGGCNEDRATFGFNTHQPGEAFHQVPIFLSSGDTDPIATPEQHKTVRASMGESGFINVRLSTYAGGHQLNNEELRTALNWFVAQAAGEKKAREALSKVPGTN
ncbi:MAG: hypothetical protein HY043_15515 [Verrucomicrobia bacterium]|nr:hypothetical protein [Verrucomicrobiota bacterium]